jgi:uncharacterized protein (TIGR03118 family)
MLNAVAWKRCARFFVSLCLCLFSTFSVAQHFTVTNLVSNIAIAPNLDPNLVNAWGLARSSTSPWWVTDNGTGLTSLYNTAGTNVGTFTIPGLNGDPSAPTGIVFNFSSGFLLPNGNKAIFIFVTEDGTIAGWNGGPTAVTKIDRSANSAYKGAAIALINGAPFLYATNFKAGTVDVFNAGFVRAFVPATFLVPGLPPGYVPFGIQNVGGNLVVTYAHREVREDDEDHGPGLGYAAIFTPLGRMIGVLKHGDYFNAPWGIAMAGGDFGTFSHRLLIGNFGDGTINAFDPITGEFQGKLLATGSSSPIVIDGLWAISFASGAAANSGAANELYFAAGPNDESNGLFGKIAPLASEQRGNGE